MILPLYEQHCQFCGTQMFKTRASSKTLGFTCFGCKKKNKKVKYDLNKDILNAKKREKWKQKRSELLAQKKQDAL